VFFYPSSHRYNHRQKKKIKKQHRHPETDEKPSKKVRGEIKHATKSTSAKVLFAIECKCILCQYRSRFGKPHRSENLSQYAAKTCTAL
jgi:hypothetical protein